MELIYKTIQENPEYFAWLFAIANVLWGAFIYFNKKSHNKELLQIGHNLSLDADKRSKKYEMKLFQFEKYFQMIDDFGKEHQADFLKKFTVHMNKLLSEFLGANDDKESKNIAITEFGSNINEMLSEGYREYNRMKSESNGLKLIASDELIEIYEEVHKSYKETFDLTSEFMSKFVDLFITNNQEQISVYSLALEKKAKIISTNLESLRKKMRQEIEEI